MLLSTKRALRHVIQSPQSLLLVLPFVIFFLARRYAQANFYRDPTSWYFDPSRGYDHIYTAVRSAQANAFVDASATNFFHRTISTPPYLCIGMLTVARPGGVIYIHTSIGSLLEGLTQEERNGIYLMPFITHAEPSKHPLYRETWLHNVVDRVLTYDEIERLTPEQFERMKELETERERGKLDREKHMFDYGLLLKECMDVNATYIAIVEDDVLALDGWYHRTRSALKDIERKEAQRGSKHFFYLRLFYTEKLLGWSLSEMNPLLLFALILTLLTPSAVLRLLRKNSFVRKQCHLLFAVSHISLILFIFLFFTSGAVSLFPIPHGTHEMPKNGCCAQGIVYPRTKITLLTQWYEKHRIGFVDSLAEELADTNPDQTGARWAITPSVLQHIGGRSSKGDNWGSDKPGEMSQAEKLWNFEFELNNAQSLREEHNMLAWQDEVRQ